MTIECVSEEKVKNLLAKRSVGMPAWTENYFDLTAGETTEVYVFRVEKSISESIEHFVAAAILRLCSYHDFNHDELMSELQNLEIVQGSGDVMSTLAWHGISSMKSRPLALQSSFSEFADYLKGGSCLYQIECGRSLVREFVIAQTHNEFVSLYWYTTG